MHIDYYPYAHYRRAPAVSLLADERRREGRLPAFSMPDPKTNNFFPVIGVRLDKDQDDIGGKKDENVGAKFANVIIQKTCVDFLFGWIFNFPRVLECCLHYDGSLKSRNRLLLSISTQANVTAVTHQGP